MLWFGWILLALRMANHWSSCYPGLSRVVTVGVTELLFLVEIMVIQWVCSWANLLISERTSSHFCEEPGKVFMVSLEGDLGQWFRDVVFNLCPAKDSELFRTTDHLFTSLGLKKKKKVQEHLPGDCMGMEGKSAVHFYLFRGKGCIKIKGIIDWGISHITFILWFFSKIKDV